jgi:uncharacterized protein
MIPLISSDLPPEGPELYFRKSIAAGRFLIQICRSTGQYVFYPRLFLPGNADIQLEWVECSGSATVYATTVLRRRPVDGGDINIAIVQLAEGPRLMSRVIDLPPEKVEIGMKVSLKIGKIDGKDAIICSQVSGHAIT